MIRKKILMMIALLLFSSVSWASQSCVVKSNQSPWDIKFKITNSEMFETVTAKKKNGSSEIIVFWTNAISKKTDAIFADNKVSKNEDYEVWIFYDPADADGHKAGLATYYIKSGTGWEFVESKVADFTSLHGSNIRLSSSSQRITSLSCNENAEHPNVINRSPKFEFGTVDCSMGASCTIKFEEKFNTVPLVFVMPVIDKSLTKKSPRTSEYPSTVGVKGVTKTEATLYQHFAPAAAKDNGVSFVEKSKTPMGSIDYFAIEQGVLELTNGAKIVAGTTVTKTAASQYSGERNNGDWVAFSDYGLASGFEKEPGVLVQPQTQNNNKSQNWFTGMARDTTKERFKVALEMSEVYDKKKGKEVLNVLDQQEEVAFVAGDGFGYINGKRFWLGGGKTEYTLQRSDPVIDPIYDGCEVYTSFPYNAGFESPPVLVANKNSRQGPNGGWLRRCDVTKDSVAFIVEEDMQSDKERGHLSEDVGWFMFEKANTNPMCNGFNSPVQTWKRPYGYTPIDAKDGQLHLYGSPVIVGAPLVDGKRVLGFLPGNIYDQAAACSGQTCTSDDGLMVGQEALEDFPKHLGDSRRVLVGETLILDDDNQTYESLSVGGTVIIKSGRYKIGKIDVWEDGKVIIKSGNSVKIDTRSLAVNNRSYFGIEITSWANPQLPVLADAELRVNVHNIPKPEDREYVDLNGNAQYVGLLYSEKHVEMSGNAAVYGAVSARSIQLTSSAKIQAATECLDLPTSYELTVTPTKQYALTCGEDQPSFIIETKNGTQPESTGVTVGVGPNESGLSVQVVDNVGSGSYPHFITSKSSSNLGKLKLSVMVTDNDKIELNKDYKLNVTLDNDSSKTLTSTFRFVPYKFDVQPQFVIAGQDSQVETKVLACKNDSQTVVKSYEGTPIVEWDIVTPAAGRKEESLFTYAPMFSDGSKGVTSGPFKLIESGVYTVTLTDTKFTCDPNYSSDCPIAPKGDDSSQSLETVLTGSFIVQSRPLKIAACNIVAKNDGKLNPGTKDTDSGFIPSGDRFSVTYKPVVHSDSKGQASDICDYPVTQNFFSAGSAKALFDTEFSVAYPSSTDSDIANLGDKQQLEFNKDNAKSGLTVEYAWNEVGSLDLKTTGTYFQKPLTDNHVTIGRFYPKYFQVIGSNWTYPDAQSFTYMGQPFDGVSYSVEALNSNEDSLKNYALFESGVQAKFNIDELGSLSERFDAPNSTGRWDLLDKAKSIGSFTIDGNSICGADSTNRAFGSACFIKDFDKLSDSKDYADGPYNMGGEVTKIGLVDAKSSDPVSFLNVDTVSDSRLISQPNIRFGRVALDDVGGRQGDTLRIPLRVEYWNSKLERFVQNIDDDGTVIYSVLDGNPETIWHDGKSDCLILLEGHDTVTDGATRELSARQDPNSCDSVGRQQSRLSLRLKGGSNNLPWLKYDWDNDGSEENPSSVVTFGIHRGNDRVIYRGEPGLTAQ